jgi:hypothetical protein
MCFVCKTKHVLCDFILFSSNVKDYNALEHVSILFVFSVICM